MSPAPIKLSPIFPIAQGLGARFVDGDGWRVPEVYTAVEAEVEAARQGVALADETPNGRLEIQGLQAEAVVSQVFALPALAVGVGATSASARIYRLRPDHFFVSTPPGGEAAVQERLTGATREAGLFVTVTDITQGGAEIRVIGPTSPELLRKVCGLDFELAAFPDGEARQTSAARTAQLIVRRDCGPLPAFSLIGRRSLGAYLWDVLMRAGREWQAAPIGRAALEALAEA